MGRGCGWWAGQTRPQMGLGEVGWLERPPIVMCGGQPGVELDRGRGPGPIRVNKSGWDQLWGGTVAVMGGWLALPVPNQSGRAD